CYPSLLTLLPLGKGPLLANRTCPRISKVSCEARGISWTVRVYCAVRLGAPPPPPPGPPAGRKVKFSASMLGPVLGAGLAQRIAPFRSAGLAGAWLKEMVKACASLGASLATCHSATLPFIFSSMCTPL